MNSSIIGTYVLALRLETACRLPVGRLGELEFPVGWYLYVGSARGPGGLRARLARHLRRQDAGKRAHWHIDYLREHATWGGAWAVRSERDLECEWVAVLGRLPQAETVAQAFGSSDCRCPAHLVRVPSLPDGAWFSGALGAERFLVDDKELDDLIEILVAGSDEAREDVAAQEDVAALFAAFGVAAVERLSLLLSEDDADTRWWASRALAEIQVDSAASPLIGALSDVDPDVRACAALALGKMGASSAAPALAGCLADESTFVASVAGDALAMMGEPAVETLAAMLTDERSHARLLAVRALSRIKSQSAIGPLFGALEDSSYLVRYYAQEGLEALGVGMVYVVP